MTSAEALEKTRTYGMNLFFETSAENGTNVETSFRETSELIFLNYSTQINLKEFVPPPDPVVLNKSLVLIIFATFFYLWILFTPNVIKLKSVIISTIYAIIEFLFKNSIVYLQNGDITLRPFSRKKKTYKIVRKIKKNFKFIQSIY